MPGSIQCISSSHKENGDKRKQAVEENDPSEIAEVKIETSCSDIISDTENCNFFLTLVSSKGQYAHILLQMKDSEGHFSFCFLFFPCWQNRVFKS